MKISGGNIIQQATMQMKQRMLKKQKWLFQKNIAKKQAPVASSAISPVAEAMNKKKNLKILALMNYEKQQLLMKSGKN